MPHRQVELSVDNNALDNYPYYAMALQALAMGLPEFDEESFDAGVNINLAAVNTTTLGGALPLSAENTQAIDEAFSPFRHTSHPTTALGSFDDFVSEPYASAWALPEGKNPPTYTTSLAAVSVDSSGVPHGSPLNSFASDTQGQPTLQEPAWTNTQQASACFRAQIKAFPGPSPLRTVQTAEPMRPSGHSNSHAGTRRLEVMAKFHDHFAAATMSSTNELLDDGEEVDTASAEHPSIKKQREPELVKIGEKKKRGLGKKTIAARTAAAAAREESIPMPQPTKKRKL